MAQQAAMQGALLQHERIRKSTELPLFYGQKDKDTIDAQDFLARFESASTIAGWVPAVVAPALPNYTNKCEQFYLLLRGKAVDWWKSLLDIPDFNHQNWPAIRVEFIASYCPRYTARTACLSFTDLSQQNGESVHDFYLRVSRAYQLLKDTRFPEVTARRLGDPDMDPEDGRLARVQAFGNAAKVEGVDDMGRYLIQQLFTAGLHEDIRIKTMEADERSFIDAYKRAMLVETIVKDKRGSKPLVSQIQGNDEEDFEEPQDDEDDELLDQVNAIRHSRGKPPIKFSSRPKSKITISCRFCKATGHFQKDCRKRISARAPMVDQNGKPYTSNGGRVQSVEEEDEGTQEASVESIDAKNFYGICSIRSTSQALNSHLMF